MLQIVEFNENDDLEFGKIRKMDTEARKKERKKESKENRGGWGDGSKLRWA